MVKASGHSLCLLLCLLVVLRCAGAQDWIEAVQFGTANNQVLALMHGKVYWKDAKYKDPNLFTESHRLKVQSDTPVVKITREPSGCPCALFADGRLTCFGPMPHGHAVRVGGCGQQLGGYLVGDTLPFVELPSGTKVRDVQSGYKTSCVILDDDTVRCWGQKRGLGHAEGWFNPNIYVGDAPGDMGDNLPVVNLGQGRIPVRFAEVSRKGDMCVEFSDGDWKCWGFGITDVPMLNAQTGENRGEMGDNLPAVDFGGQRPKEVQMDSGIVCAIMEGDSIRCSSTASRAAPGRTGQGPVGSHESCDDKTGRALGSCRNGLWHWKQREAEFNRGFNGPSVDFGDKTVLGMSMGYRGSWALLSDGTVNYWGEVGQPNWSPVPQSLPYFMGKGKADWSCGLTHLGANCTGWGKHIFENKMLVKLQATLRGGIAIAEDGTVFEWIHGVNDWLPWKVDVPSPPTTTTVTLTETTETITTQTMTTTSTQMVWISCGRRSSAIVGVATVMLAIWICGDM